MPDYPAGTISWVPAYYKWAGADTGEIYDAPPPASARGGARS